MPDLLLLAAWSIAWIIAGGISVIALIACAAGLVKQGSILKRTLERFREETQPLTDDISAGAARASETAERVQRRRP